ncbi:glycosyltransferase family 39 protein [Pantanalinema rosaneae CENA516]|uniref:ArnT family glycosyltransferase n=1 Tax=Pantanalinema rosaneae TaxID=1620701 RepID=UPI003D6E60BC
MKHQQIDRFWTLGLILAAGLLFSINLGALPLRDWDEGIVAQVAREMWRAPEGSLTWLYPTLGGEPYLNKPPLVYWLIALTYQVGGVNEWTTRLPGAMLAALSVPLLYGIGKELFLRRTSAVLAALIYLTLLPVVRHGRLAMLDGALVCFFLIMLFCLLRARRDLRWGLGVGIGLGLVCLTKGIVGLLLGAIALVFILWDTPRLLTSVYLWTGIGLGGMPVAAWYWAQWLRYGEQFLSTHLISQSLSRIWIPIENNHGAPWYYVLELLKYTLPWLIFLPQGFHRAWEHRNLGWAKLVLVWTIGYLGVISLMSTKLPWYIMPLYPALALVAGNLLSESWNLADLTGWFRPVRRPYPIAWAACLGLLAIVGWSGCLYFNFFAPIPKPELALILITVAITMTTAAILVKWRDSQFIPVLLWGMYIALMFLMASRYWVWELNEAYSVKPVAALVQQGTPAGATVITSYPNYRPSLNFYSDRRVLPVNEVYRDHQPALTTSAAIAEYWQQTDHPYLLVDAATLNQLSLNAAHRMGEIEGWILVTHQSAKTR